MSQSNETLYFAHVAQEKKCKWDKNIQYLTPNFEIPFVQKRSPLFSKTHFNFFLGVWQTFLHY